MVSAITKSSQTKILLENRVITCYIRGIRTKFEMLFVTLTYTAYLLYMRIFAINFVLKLSWRNLKHFIRDIRNHVPIPIVVLRHWENSYFCYFDGTPKMINELYFYCHVKYLCIYHPGEYFWLVSLVGLSN